MPKDKLLPDTLEEFEEEMLVEQVNEVFQQFPNNWVAGLERIGFIWFDDEDHQEELEEEQTIPENLNQELLVAYFEGHVPLDDKVLEVYVLETHSETCNVPLLKKYFKRGNLHIKALLLYGLEQSPTNRDLLLDLAALHEHRSILSDVIHVYLNACQLEEDLERFELLARDFELMTHPDGYNALYELKQIFSPNTDKGKVVEQIAEELIEEIGIEF